MTKTPQSASPIFFSIDSQQGVEDSFRKDVLDGLSQSPKSISSKYFYDDLGSQLFDQICQQPEYFITGTELALLPKASELLRQHCGDDLAIAEWGVGLSHKIRILLDRTHPSHYVAVEIHQPSLEDTLHSLDKDYKSTQMVGIIGDFTSKWKLPEGLFSPGSEVVGFIPGSTLGNFSPAATRQLLQAMAENLSSVSQNASPWLLVGIDICEDAEVLQAAYNDAAGVTAQFNQNLCTRLKRDLGATINPQQFKHLATYDPVPGIDGGRQVTMFLESCCRQEVILDDRQFVFEQGERLMTEASRKFTVPAFERLAVDNGWKPIDHICDAQKRFCNFSAAGQLVGPVERAMALVVFDLDGTLLDGDSDYQFAQYLSELGLVEDVQVFSQKAHQFDADYRAGSLDMDAYVKFLLQPLASLNRAEIDQLMRDYCQTQVVSMIRRDAGQLLQSHRQAGDHIVLSTATNCLITQPIADYLQVDALLATEVEWRDHRLTGRIAGLSNFQQNKVVRLQAYALAKGLDLQSSLGYSDSINDLHLLECVGQAVAVCPDARLAEVAQQKGWQVLDLGGRGLGQ